MCRPARCAVLPDGCLGPPVALAEVLGALLCPLHAQVCLRALCGSSADLSPLGLPLDLTDLLRRQYHRHSTRNQGCLGRASDGAETTLFGDGAVPACRNSSSSYAPVIWLLSSLATFCLGWTLLRSATREWLCQQSAQ